MVWLLRLVEEGHEQIGRLKVMDEYVVDVIGGRRFGKGPRHGVVSKDGELVAPPEVSPPADVIEPYPPTSRDNIHPRHARHLKPPRITTRPINR
jgi:hypothetical protein